LQSVDGVGSVDLVGARPYEVRVEFDPQRMLAAGIELGPLTDTLAMGGIDTPAGVFKTGDQAYDVQFNNEPDDPLEFGNLIVLNRKELPVRIKDVADVKYVAAEADSYAFLKGQPALGLDIRKSSGANTTDVADSIYKTVEKLQQELPSSMNLEIVTDDSTFIRSSVEDVQKTLIEGAVLCICVVFLFLVSWRSTIITGLTLPISIIGAFLAILMFGFTLNNMTLMALSLAVGLLIDDAIVVRENIIRTLRTGLSHKEASLKGTAEIGPAVLATTLTVVAVFIPVAFMGGIIGKFFFSFGITIASAVLISLFVSFTMDPMLSAYWYDPQGMGLNRESKTPLKEWMAHVQEGFTNRRKMFFANLRGSVLRNIMSWPFILGAIVVNMVLNALHYVFSPVYMLYFFLIRVIFLIADRFDHWFDRTADNYAVLINWVLRHRSLIILIAIGSFVLAIVLLGQVGGEFFPRFDRGEFSVSVNMPVGMNIESTVAAARKVEDYCLGLPETKLTYVTIGGGINTARSATIKVNLVGKRERKRTVFAIMDDVRQKFQDTAGMDVSIVSASVGGGGKSIQLFISGARLDELDTLATQIKEKLTKIKGAVDVTKSEITGSPTFEVKPYPFQNSALEYRESDLASRVYAGISGRRIRSWQDPQGLDHDLVLRLPEEKRNSVNALGMIPIEASYKGTGETINVPLSRLAEIRPSSGPAEIQRYDLQRRITVDGNAQGVPVGDIMKEIRPFIASLNMPSGYQVIESGDAEMMKETQQNVMIAMILSVLFIYFILASQFENLVYPLSIMLSLPLSLVGVAIMLLLTGDTLNMMSMIGLVMLMGLVTKNAILLVEFTNQLRKRGMQREAALALAGRTRLRPIIMTTLAMIFGMLPLALALGEGGEFRAPMARAVIGGLITATMLTLIVVPVAYSVIDDMFMRWKLKSLDEDHTADENQPAGAEHSPE
jgi:hydrophobic/amphiphilic exporter-1 (mainly G- bacteria), HAE1 family